MRKFRVDDEEEGVVWVEDELCCDELLQVVRWQRVVCGFVGLFSFCDEPFLASDESWEFMEFDEMMRGSSSGACRGFVCCCWGCEMPEVRG